MVHTQPESDKTLNCLVYLLKRIEREGHKMAEKIKMVFDRIEECPIKGYPAPILVLKGENGSEAYMMPFRCYSIQICGNTEGVHDMGSSGIIGLAHITDLAHQDLKYGEYGYQSNSTPRETAEELIRGLASQAMLDFFTNNYGKDFKFDRSYHDRELLREWSSRVVDYVDQQVHR